MSSTKILLQARAPSLASLFALSCLVLNLGCSTNQSSHPIPQSPSKQHSGDGTQHGGGHKINLTSTREQVEHAIDFSLEASRQNSIFSRFFSSDMGDPEISERDKKVLRTVFFLDGIEKGYASIDFYLSRSKINKKNTGSCGPPSLDHADASVSNFEIGADLCFSLENLMKIPPNTLIPQVFSLLLHEAAHLRGFGEEDAVRLQKRAFKYFSGTLNVESSARARDYIKNGIQILREKLGNAAELNRIQPGSPFVLLLVGEAWQVFRQWPYPESYSFDLNWTPKYPLLQDNFDRTMNKIWTTEFTPLGFILTKVASAQQLSTEQFPTGSKLQELLDAAADDADIFETNWIAYTTGDTKPVCVLDSWSSTPTADKNCEAILRNWPQTPPQPTPPPPAKP